MFFCNFVGDVALVIDTPTVHFSYSSRKLKQGTLETSTKLKGCIAPQGHKATGDCHRVGSSVSKNYVVLERIFTCSFCMLSRSTTSWCVCHISMFIYIYIYIWSNHVYIYIYTYIIKISHSPNDLLSPVCFAAQDTIPFCPILHHVAQSWQCQNTKPSRDAQVMHGIGAKMPSYLVPSLLGNKLLGASALLVFRRWFSHLIIYSCFETLRVLFGF